MLLKKELTDEERDKKTRQLARRARKAARREMVELNMPLAKHIAGSYVNITRDREDIEQDAYIGLCRAVEKFDPDSDNTFSTYAGFWIRCEIICGLKSRTIVRIFSRDRTFSNVAKRFIKDYYHRFQREPTDDEIAKAINRKAEEVPIILGVPEVASNRAIVPLDDPEKSDRDYSAEGEDTAPYFEGRAIARRVLKDGAVLLVLTEMERAAIDARFELSGSDSLTAQETAEKYHCTKTYINMLAVQALKKLRHYFVEKNLVPEQQLD